jgi:D-cysteine desulfhydrase
MNSPFDSLDRIARARLLDGPTPIQRLNRLESVLGKDVAIHVKRDDLMSLGAGGSKLRKLEFLMGDALAQGCDAFVTTGGLQSNHARLSAAACARLGLKCEVVLAPMVRYHGDGYRDNGNVLLDKLLGATVHEVPEGTDALAFAHERAAVLRSLGFKPYVAGLGGSTPVGALGYVSGARELLAQEAERGEAFSHIVLPTGSCGTHAGLSVGLAMASARPQRLQAFTVLSPRDVAMTKTRELIGHLQAQLEFASSEAADAVRIDEGQLGDDYGIPTDAMREAVRLMAQTEGLLLDPVYSGKAFAGLLHDIRHGAIPPGSSVLFIMTGGMPGLFAYREVFDADQVRRTSSSMLYPDR